MTIDFRTQAGVEASILQEVFNNGEVALSWLAANRNRPAALARLEARGAVYRLPIKHPSVLRFSLGPVPKPNLVRRLLGRWLS